MSPKVVTVGGYPLAYLEANPQATETIFFIHGNSGSARTWHRQLNDPSLKGFRMIAFDLPAHGDSPAAAHPGQDYTLPALGKLIARAVEEMAGNNRYYLVGFSLGSNVLTEALPALKPAGIALSGSSVTGSEFTMDKIFQPGLDGSVFFSDVATAEAIGLLAGDISYHPGDVDKELTIADYKRVKTGFRPALMQSVMAGAFSDEVSLLQQTDLPILVLFGREDRMVDPHYLDNAPFRLYGGRVFRLPEAGHAAHVDQPEVFNGLLLNYVREYSAPSGGRK